MIRVINKGNKLYSIIYNYCPRCQSEKFWPKNNPYKNILVNNGGDLGSCKNCNFKYEIEPGFWYGAMYVSYAIGVAIMLFLLVLSITIFPEINTLNQIFFVTFFILLSSPINYHYSRLIWINIFVHYKNDFL